MKCKVGIIDKDVLYLDRFVQRFSNVYADKFELFSFTNLESFKQASQKVQLDIVLASDEIKVSKDLIPARTGFAYLTSDNDIEMIEDFPAIGKYQSAEKLYKQIVGLYANNETINVMKKNINGKCCKVIMTTSASGGVGTSTVAVSLAKYLAGKNNKVLFLNLEKNAAHDLVFEGTGQGNFSDVIYLLKSNKNNIALRIESLVQQDTSRVFYFHACLNLLDRMELDSECMNRLLKEVCAFGDYDYVVLDMPFQFDDSSFLIADYADSLLVVADGTQVGCQKLKQFFDTLTILDLQKQMHILPKCNLIYNRFSSKTGCQAQDVSFPVIGGTPRYEGVNERQLSEEIARLSFFEKCE